MTRPITTAIRSPRACALMAEFEALLPPNTALFVVAVGQVDETGGREVCLGGHLDATAERLVAADIVCPDEKRATLVSATSLARGLN